ncbi:DNA ligase (NAD(+)) LigA [Virgibacillus profundi]|uniref:DNA ligase n=1 Tax=Virgibacillus profundi TaxID=2024555 RepID=A0A2A2IGK0_9BACI|nr:NAD-dependent DNA ligase LigA [Virgibacillus profundi]PAV30270.1 DNA ligase (NAD(+)) LigA [Virgibacillus profundi]PXY54442.1 NAD-dependent DNA ligase LigA [Virgibacillus profundi]
MRSKLQLLIEQLNHANHEYYNLNEPVLSDKEYDKLYDELLQLEKESNILYSNSPSQNVGYEVKSELTKVKHEIPLLSLDKTKSLDELEEFIGDKECILSIKLDGLATKISYQNGQLRQGSTRGSGTIGEDISHNVKVFKNVPLNSDVDVTVVGESIITDNDFNIINEQFNEEDKYSNSRNLVSGSVRQLNSEICKDRHVKFIAYGIQSSDFNFKKSELESLSRQGFDVVPYKYVSSENFREAVVELQSIAKELGYPTDGLVCTYDNIQFSNSLGSTSKFPRHSIALKHDDEVHETTFRGLELNTTRTGIVSLVGLFDPVNIDGAMVSKASLHNVDIFESLQLGIGDTITVRRANMVIPQIMDNLTRSNTFKIPQTCNECGSQVEVRTQKEARFLHCPNSNCKAQLMQRVVHYASRDAMNIVGLSEATVKRFIEQGYIKSVSDLYDIDKFKDGITQLEGFGKKSYDRLFNSIESTKHVNFANFIYGLGIPNTGRTASKILAEVYNSETFLSATKEDILRLDGIGNVLASHIYNWITNQKNIDLYNELLSKGITFEETTESEESSIAGLTFVVTGKVNRFKNRKELSADIEQNRATVKGSISKNTDYLINNDKESSSSKNVAAKKLGVPIISEEEYLNLINK